MKSSSNASNTPTLELSKAIVLSKKAALIRTCEIVALSICLTMLLHSSLPAVPKLASLIVSSSSGLAPRFSAVIITMISLFWLFSLLTYLVYLFLARHRCSRYVLAQGSLIGERTCCGLTWSRVVYDIAEGDQLLVAESAFYDPSRSGWIYPITLQRAHGSALVLQYALGKRAAESTLALLCAHYPSLSQATSYTKPALSPQQARMRSLCILSLSMLHLLLAVSGYYYSYPQSSQHWGEITAQRELHEPINAARLRYSYEGVSYISPIINLTPLLSHLDASGRQYSLFVNKDNPRLLAPHPYGSVLWLYLGISCIVGYFVMSFAATICFSLRRVEVMRVEVNKNSLTSTTI